MFVPYRYCLCPHLTNLHCDFHYVIFPWPFLHSESASCTLSEIIWGGTCDTQGLVRGALLWAPVNTQCHGLSSKGVLYPPLLASCLIINTHSQARHCTEMKSAIYVCVCVCIHFIYNVVHIDRLKVKILKKKKKLKFCLKVTSPQAFHPPC